MESKLARALLLRKHNYAEPEDHFASRKFGSMSTDEGKAAMTEAKVADMAEGKPIDMQEGFKAVLAAQQQLLEHLQELKNKLK